ncbi:MFS transporter [Telmatospirillum sp.]|uniref:MFS transporter n=1 Tax=Telmatospirillum sp. TaxID=2079197 RepID=UPI002847E975|nr:MFS transporter [Telmatospirillum sp.]MDR3438062.1 MFS transporter [Telmatospirillum sp.]
MAQQSKIWRVFQVSSGNFLEMYDFMVFGYYAKAIGNAFFPNGSEFASLMATFMTFGAGFLMRPLGAILLGSYIDHHGRRKGLILTLGLMAIGTLTIACVPGYETVGFVAPLIVVSGRLLQGLSAGVELGGVSVYLSEIATPGRKGFYVSWQSASQQVAVMFAALLGVLLSSYLPPEQMFAWGWRVPLIIGCVIIPFIFLLRRTLQETEEFQSRTHHLSPGEIFRSVAANWRLVLIGTFMVTISNAAFYMITAYTPTFGNTVLKLSSLDALVVTLCVGLSNFIFVPLGGILSDKVGRKPVLVASAGLILLTAYPMMAWLVTVPSFNHLLAVELWLSILYSAYNGGMIVYVTEIMPAEVRTAGFSLAYSLSQTIFGGFTPAISTYLIHLTNDKAAPGAWLSVAAVCALSAVCVNWRREVAIRRRADRFAPTALTP